MMDYERSVAWGPTPLGEGTTHNCTAKNNTYGRAKIYSSDCKKVLNLFNFVDRMNF